MKDSRRFLTIEEIMNIPEAVFPLAVLSDNQFSPVAGAIKGHTKGAYNHFMWMHRPGFVASQDMTFKEVPVKEYLEGEHRLKFWHNPSWTLEQRRAIVNGLKKDLEKPLLYRLYDWLAIPGQWLGWKWLQFPVVDICSDKARLLALVDFRYDLESPDPQEVNAWFERTHEYEVYGRYLPD